MEQKKSTGIHSSTSTPVRRRKLNLGSELGAQVLIASFIRLNVSVRDPPLPSLKSSVVDPDPAIRTYLYKIKNGPFRPVLQEKS